MDYSKAEHDPDDWFIAHPHSAMGTIFIETLCHSRSRPVTD
jgi:hypothetical protein